MITSKKLSDISDNWLNTKSILDYNQAVNGLQIENLSEIKKIAVAVDSSLKVIEKACNIKANMIIVHHGLFWQGSYPITNSFYKKIKLLIDNDIALYSSHIPLDIHPEIGNNICLIKELNLSESITPFFKWKDINLGMKVECNINIDDLIERVRNVTGKKPHVCLGGPKKIRSIGVITGGAGSQIADLNHSEIDTFITGEGPHWSYTFAEEIGINVIYAGHYATEVFGVKELSKRLCESFKGLNWEFIDHPTGL